MKIEYPLQTTEWINSTAQPPTRKDANNHGEILIVCRDGGGYKQLTRKTYIQLESYKWARNTPKVWFLWAPAPNAPTLPKVKK